MKLRQRTAEVTHFTLFSGLGGISLGLNQGHARVGRVDAHTRCLGGVDANAAAIKDFEALTGCPGTVMDLFDREDYEAFHGAPPPADWREVTPWDLFVAAGYEHPDILCTSPPCKGFSGLLNKKHAASKRYQALNGLTLRGIVLAMEAFKECPPKLVLLENVPRIQTRGRDLVDAIRGILEYYGYAVAETTHDCGEIGGLAQHRKRFLMVARHRDSVPHFLYQPPKQAPLTVGDVLSNMPLPDDATAGPMHRLPSLQLRTWMRLALIPAGKDWKSLAGLRVKDGALRDYQLVPDLGDYHAYKVSPWDGVNETVTSRAAPGSGAFSVADPRNRHGWGGGKYRITRWDEAAGCVIASSDTGQGAFAVADIRLGCDASNTRKRRYNNVYAVTAWDEVGRCVTGGGGNSKGYLSDPRSPASWDDLAPGGVLLPPTRQCKPFIESLDGAWHRPYTTLELAALQGFPVLADDGTGLLLSGVNDERWRERIGNAVPPPTAAAIGSVMLDVLLRAELKAQASLPFNPIWVRPERSPLTDSLTQLRVALSVQC
ncbi:DNA cytosine methyltransferase [Candidatus Pacearchaeota archaeon]|nr:DNA cytosine methyltransferase [Candidatus Pacearchaeota archaeon]|tara:strand:+ start:3123 stop:4754 length:1632 start_codon:yes stop_codon:yes gene_type:complete